MQQMQRLTHSAELSEGWAYEKDLNINRAQNASEEMVSDPISFTSEIFHNFYLYSICDTQDFGPHPKT